MIERDGVLDFDAMQMRLHPAESRVRKLATEIPARFIAFDILLWEGEELWPLPLAERRRELEVRASRFTLSPATTDRGAALAWLEHFEAAGLDGVVGKRADSPYLAGSRDAIVKVKPEKSADCVVVGVRWKSRPDRLATLLLGIYGENGELDYVGSAAVAASRQGEMLDRILPLLEEAPDPALLGAEPLGGRRARGVAGATRAGVRGALRQGAGAPLPPRDTVPPLAARQEPGRMHVGQRPAAPRLRWPDARRPARQMTCAPPRSVRSEP